MANSQCTTYEPGATVKVSGEVRCLFNEDIFKRYFIKLYFSLD